jgi:hypothetical protein
MLLFFSKRGGVGLCGYKPLWFRQYIYFIDIPSWISKGDKSGKGYFSYILFHICTPQYTVQNRKLSPSLSGSTLCLLNPVIVFVRKVLTYE